MLCLWLASGDEVVQWNGIRLRGLTFEEVYDIIFESKFDPQVELTVYRPVGNTQQRRNDTGDCLANTEGLSVCLSVHWSQSPIHGFDYPRQVGYAIPGIYLFTCWFVNKIAKKCYRRIWLMFSGKVIRLRPTSR